MALCEKSKAFSGGGAVAEKAPLARHEHVLVDAGAMRYPETDVKIGSSPEVLHDTGVLRRSLRE